MQEGTMRVAVDAVVFTIMHDELRILLIKRKYEPFQGKYALPGGFVHADEELEHACQRELEEETNVQQIFLKQFGAYGGVKRDPRGRILSVAYFALIRPEQKLIASFDATEPRWHSVYDLPELGFDHSKIIADALRQLRYELQTTNIAFQILPERFTLRELQQVYELVLDKKLDKRNFRKRIKELRILEETAEHKMEGAHRPAQLYRFCTPAHQNIRKKVNVFLQ